MIKCSSLNNLLIVTFLAGMVSFGGCSRQPSTNKAEEPEVPERDPAVVTVSGSQTVHEDDQGRPVWKIRAESMKADEQNSTVEVTGGDVTVYDKGVQALRFTSNKVKANARDRTLVAHGGIQVQSTHNKTEFNAEQLTVDLTTSRIVASGGISGSNNAGTFQADKLETDLRFDNVQVTAEDRVRGRIKVSE